MSIKVMLRVILRYLLAPLALLVVLTVVAALTQNVSAHVPAPPGTDTLTGAPITHKEAVPLVQGDANGDGVCDGIDYSILKAYWGHACNGDPLCTRADFNHDGFVNLSDYDVLKLYFGLPGEPVGAPPPSIGNAYLSLQPGIAGNCAAPPNGGTVQVGCRFVLDMMVNMNSVTDGVVMQGYMTSTSSVVQNARVSSIASSCVLTGTVTADTTLFDAGMQNFICDGPNPCIHRGMTIDPGSLGYAFGALSNCPTGCGGTFRVAQVGLCAVATGQAVLHWEFSPPQARNRHTAIIDVNGNMVQDQSLFTDYIINVVAVPSPTPSPTDTPTNTPTSTPLPAAIIAGHLTWQGVDAANRPLITGTLLLCVSGSAQSFGPFTTDTGGYFTLTTTLPDGAYHWRIKGGRFLSNSSPTDGADLVISNGYATQEFGTQKGGDCCGAGGGFGPPDNLVDVSDFEGIKHYFGLSGLRSSDFNYDYAVDVPDFNILKTHFGQAGHTFTCP